MEIAHAAPDLLVVLLAGAVAGIVCKRIGVSLLVGYLLVGALIGGGGLGLLADTGHELRMIAEAGALLMLFGVGIEFSFDELVQLRRFFFVGGATQMALAAVPLGFAAWWWGIGPAGAILAGLAGSFSSTVLVFRALTEEGQSESPHGRRGVAVLLFQDAALVPLLLLTPVLLGGGAAPTVGDYLLLAVKSVAFLAGVCLLHWFVQRVLAPFIAALRAVEVVVLSAVTVLGALCYGAFVLGLPPAVGAFAAGIVLSGNRLSKRIDSVVLPFRETFAAVFFVTLGMLLRPMSFFGEPALMLLGLLAVVVVKTLAAAIALRGVGLPWRPALGMGLGLAQLGEFSFLLIARAVEQNVIDQENYNRMLFIAVASLVLTPWLLRRGLQWAGNVTMEDHAAAPGSADGAVRALVVGIGPIGGQVAARLETLGVDVALMDLSPINLHSFAQMGFATYSGDARDPEALARADVARRDLVVVCVPRDDLALDIVRAVRQVNDKIAIITRCRYQAFTSTLRRAGALRVISEEYEAARPLMLECDAWMERARRGGETAVPKDIAG